MGHAGGWNWIVSVLFVLIVIGIPFAQILRRVGHHPAWAIIVLVPLLNLIGLWVLAFIRWPALDAPGGGASGGGAGNDASFNPGGSGN